MAMEVLVFKTSVQSIESVRQLEPMLNHLAGLNQWNFALEDCDHVLRIISPVKVNEAIEVLIKQGFVCEELE
ncbi:MAG TPA: hypothetical protein PLM56_01535 [Cyclobacteriaceae bacterium]|jgi:hypothetical protein|nr:hypothetical protein [Cyclobacteriaceae bacterium]HRE66158.1 hypothetical protein [Cyclobacteriaceae bacterium]HRF32151.1 hypothetical protein [Cyclobacteriaceae bacterium]